MAYGGNWCSRYGNPPLNSAMHRNPGGIFLQLSAQKPMRNGVSTRSWITWGYMRFSHQDRVRIGPNSGKHRRIPHRLRHRLWRCRHRHIYSPQTGRPRLWHGREIMCTPGIHESHGHKWRLGRKEGAGEKWQIQLPTRLHQPPQPPGEKRLESLSKQFHHRSTRLATYKPVPYETGVARCREQKHARSHTE